MKEILKLVADIEDKGYHVEIHMAFCPCKERTIVGEVVAMTEKKRAVALIDDTAVADFESTLIETLTELKGLLPYAENTGTTSVH